MALVQATSSPSSSAALLHARPAGHRLRAAHLDSLPIARDGRGRSFTFTLPSPKTPQPSSPFDSLRAARDQLRTPRSKQYANSPLGTPRSVVEAPAQECPQLHETPLPAENEKEKAQAQLLHLERCFEAPSVVKPANTGFTMQSLRPAASEFDVAYQGTPTGRALSNVYPQSSAIRLQQSEDVFSAIQQRKADRGMLPVENTLDGTNHRTYDLLLRHNLHIVGEMLCPATAPDCSTIANLDLLPNASCTATDLFNRFWVLAKDPVMPRQEEGFKTTVALVLTDGLGALYKILAAFSFRDIKVTKIESRPWRHDPLRKVDRGEAGVAKYFQYVVFIDFQGSLADRAAQNALTQLQQVSSFMRVLGSYPTVDISRITKTSTGEVTPLWKLQQQQRISAQTCISALLNSSSINRS